jgi:purine nucleoside permease
MRTTRLISTIALASMLMSGCVVKENREMKIPNTPNTSQKDKPMVINTPKQESSAFVSTLDGLLKTKGNFIEIVGKKSYKEGDNISFTLDTKEQIGFLYILTVDKNEVTFLQPNPVSPLNQMRGKREFPKDFTDGKFNIKAVKFCKKKCEEEKTVIYALLTEKPIDDIRNINRNKLLNFHKNSSQAKKTRGAIVDIINSSNSSQSAIGKMEFFVK